MGRGGKNNKKKAGEPDTSGTPVGEDSGAPTTLSNNNKASTSMSASSTTTPFDPSNMSVSEFNRRVGLMRKEFVELSCRAALYKQRQLTLEAENAATQEKYQKHYAELTITKENHSAAQNKLLKVDNLLKQMSERMKHTEESLEAEVNREKAKRQEISKQFSETLSGISFSLESLGKNRERIITENIELKETLTKFLEQYEKTQGADDELFSVDRAVQREEVERIRLEENKREDEAMMMNYEDNQIKLLALKEIESEFQKKLIDRSVMFDTFQKRLAECSAAFSKNQGEIDALTNGVKSTEASNKALAKKIKECSPATKAIVNRFNMRVMDMEKLDKNVAVYQNLKKTLETEIAQLEEELGEGK